MQIVIILIYLVAFIAVAYIVGKLQIIQVTWMPSLGNRDDMVNYRGPWIWKAHGLIYRASTYATHILRCHDLLFS